MKIYFELGEEQSTPMCRENNVDTDPPIVEGVPWYAVPWRTFTAGNRKLWEAGRSVNSQSLLTTVIIGYYDYLGTRPKNSHRPIIVTGR